MTTDLKTLRSVATKAARRNWTDDDMQAFDDAFRPQAVLSLLDRVEAAEAMAETVRTLEAERDRLRGALRQIDNGEGAYGMQALEYKNIARAALNPTGVGEAG